MKHVKFKIAEYDVWLNIYFSELEDPDLEYTLYNIDFILYVCEIKGKKRLESFAEVYGDSAVIYAIDDSRYPIYRLLEIRVIAVNGGFRIIAELFSTTLRDIFNGSWRRKEPIETKTLEVGTL